MIFVASYEQREFVNAIMWSHCRPPLPSWTLLASILEYECIFVKKNSWPTFQETHNEILCIDNQYSNEQALASCSISSLLHVQIQIINIYTTIVWTFQNLQVKFYKKVYHTTFKPANEGLCKYLTFYAGRLPAVDGWRWQWRVTRDWRMLEVAVIHDITSDFHYEAGCVLQCVVALHQAIPSHPLIQSSADYF